MALTPRTVALVGVVALLLASGCLSGGAGTDRSPSASPTGSTPSSTGAPSTTALPAAAAADCPEWVSFYGLGSPGESLWAPDEIAIGYTVPANASVLFVAFEGETVLGTAHVSTEGLDYGVTADGDDVDLDRPLNGSQVVRVTAYADANGNEEFDRGTDRPCREDGEPVEAGPRRIDFDAFRRTATSTNGSVP